MGILHDPSSVGARALGVDLESARAALDDLDQSALAAIGIDASGVERTPIPASRKRTPFTSGARSVLARAAGEVRTARRRRIASEHVLLAILACGQPDPVAELMSRLGVDRAATRERLRLSGS